MVSVERRAKKRMIAVNAHGLRLGEDHHRAKLSDHDVELILDLLEARDLLVAEYLKVGLCQRQIHIALSKAQLSERWIADKFECSRRTVRDIYAGRIRGTPAAAWVRADTGEGGR